MLLLLGGAAVALAASGVILTGAAVPAPRFASPTAGAGLPQPGKWKLLSLRVADPAGSPPWGMRVVRTTRGLVCVQLGRVQEGVLGELGIDGAFHDDLRFHPVGPGVLPTYAGGAADGGMTSERGSCVLAYGDVVAGGQAWGSAVTAEVSGADENAAFPEAIAARPAAQNRPTSPPPTGAAGVRDPRPARRERDLPRRAARCTWCRSCRVSARS